MGILMLRSSLADNEVFPLAVHEDGRYLIDAQDVPWQIRADTAWGIFNQLSPAEVDTYFADRAAKGVNAVLCSIIDNYYADDPPNNYNAEEPFSSNMTPDLGSGYWDHADYIFAKAKEYDICLFCCIYLGFNTDGLWPIASGVSQANRIAFGEFLGARYASYANVVWLLGGDRDLDSGTEQDIVNDFYDGLVSEWSGLVALHGNRDDDQRARFKSSIFTWLPIFPVYTYDAGSSSADAANFYADTPAAPVYYMEGPYENEFNGDVNRTRILPMQAILNGAIAGEIFGNNPIWGFNATTADSYYDPDLLPVPDWEDELNSVGSQGMETRAALMNSFEWYKLEPASLITSALGSGDSQKAGAVTNDGAFGIALVPSATSTTVDLSLFSGPNVRVRWYDPITGDYTLVNTYTASGTQSVSHPGNNSEGDSDWLLVLDSVA